MGVSEKQLKTTSMPINQDLLAKGFRNLLILLGLLIASPLLLTLSFKALKLYKGGYLFYFSILGIVLSAILTFFTLFLHSKPLKH